MACPKCGCKETYEYVEDDVLGLPDDQERCAACGHIFFFEDGTDEDDDDNMTPEENEMNVTNEMVDRFLCWKLPADFYPDAGISFAPGHTIAGSPNWPTGTNLLTSVQAKAMLEHVLGVANGHCTEGDRCVCGGDTPRVRSGCANWVTPNAK